MQISARFQRGFTFWRRQKANPLLKLPKLSSRDNRGFTLIELLVVMGLSLVLTAIGVVALTRPQAQASVEAVTTTLVSDLKQQQLLSMMGDSGSQSLAQPHGARITASSYTLFTGSTFSSSTNQFALNLPQGVTFSGSSFPLDIIFTKRSGETTVINNLVIGNASGDQRTVTINRLGVITVN